jgi:hypothetical protein
MDGQTHSGKLTTLPIRRLLTHLIGSWLVVLGASHKLYGQGCAMCYTSVAGGGKAVIHALQGGIIVLLIPPVLLFSGLTVLLFRWRTSASTPMHSGPLSENLRDTSCPWWFMLFRRHAAKLAHDPLIPTIDSHRRWE